MVIYIFKSKMIGLHLSAIEAAKAIGMAFISCQNIPIFYSMETEQMACAGNAAVLCRENARGTRNC
ncbi:hypothetical protein RBH92_10980 [Nitrosomonas sp. sh817]|nr:hypothetical protein RBH92_10980 [Nitrosomonas sp. sh817]